MSLRTLFSDDQNQTKIVKETDALYRGTTDWPPGQLNADSQSLQACKPNPQDNVIPS